MSDESKALRRRAAGGGTLSNDALYAPLSAYAECASTSTSSATPGKKKKGGHSLSLQTSSSLRESSLLAFLTSTAQSLKTAHPHEGLVYRGIGGSMSRHGMGDGDRASSGMRNVLEGKLSNRSLVLVGGGVHTHPSASNVLSRSGEEVGLVGMGAQAAAGGKRIRKRVGGNGMFGCISNKKRKKLLKRAREEQSQKETSGLNAGDKSANNTASVADTQQKVGDIVATLHEMWTSYMQQLFSSSEAASGASNNNSYSATLTVEGRRQIAHTLATAEHVGMPATIVECPSRRHLVNARCVVVDETKGTWKVALLAGKRKRSAKGEAAKGECVPKEENVQSGNDTGVAGPNETDAKKGSDEAKPQPPSWKVVLVPKRGTALDINLPLVDSEAKDRPVIVRLEM